jgi:hypothetical protein
MASNLAKLMLALWQRQGQTEQVTYRPAKTGQAAREITVLVERPGAEPVMNGRAPGFRVTALNDEQVGIPSAPSLSDVGRDTLDVAERLGGTAVARGVQRFVEQDPDWVVVEIM